MKNIKTFEGFIVGPGGHINDESTSKDKLLYRINELGWLKDRFETYIDNADSIVDEQYLDELAESINKIHDLLNKLKD